MAPPTVTQSLLPRAEILNILTNVSDAGGANLSSEKYINIQSFKIDTGCTDKPFVKTHEK